MITSFSKTALALISCIIVNSLFASAALANHKFHEAPFGKKDKYNTFLYPQTSHPTKNSPWFEWWYTKVVDPKTNRGFFLVYGIVNPWDIQSTNPASRAYVTFGDFSKKTYQQKKVSVANFQASTENYLVSVQESKDLPAFAIASDDSIKGQLNNGTTSIQWNLKYENPWSFNAMGWAMNIPNLLNIFWYPAQASVQISGTITEGDETIVLDHAPGYQDRNWGSTFPKWWTWIVANQFEGKPSDDSTTLAIGGGAPEVAGHNSPYQGVSIGFKHDGILSSFRPSDGVFPKADISFGKWEVSAKNLKGEKIEISANAPSEAFMDLQFESPDGTVFHDLETLNGKVSVKLTEPGKPVLEFVSDQAGIEYGSF